MRKILLFSVAIIFLLLFFGCPRRVKLGPGVMAPDSPQQTKGDLPAPFLFKDYRITPLARFKIKAKVLSKKNYRLGREAELSPVDLALGWGRMSDEKILESIKITQSRRWYFWYTRNFPIPRREIETHSSNMHIIPKNDLIAKELRRVRQGEIVEFSGYLVRVDGEGGWRWVSSLTRTDTGSNSCEVVWVEEFRRMGKEYFR